MLRVILILVLNTFWASFIKFLILIAVIRHLLFCFFSHYAGKGQKIKKDSSKLENFYE